MKYLISFCNTNYETLPVPEKHKLFPLIFLDTDLNKYSFIRLPLNPTFLGFTGMCLSHNRVFLLTQQLKYTTIYILNKSDLTLIKKQTLKNITDAHSILYDNNILCIISSGDNSVYKYDVKNDRLIKPTRIFKQKASAKSDSHHLNAIIIQDKQIIISAFGKKNGLLKKTSKRGYIYNINSHKYLYKNIFHPHSLVIHNDDYYYCESGSSKVYRNGIPVISLKEGYTRGLTLSTHHLVVGTSNSRLISKSTGIINSTEDEASFRNKCRVLDISNRYFGGFKTTIYNFSTYFNEIYDIIELGDTKLKPSIKISPENNNLVITNSLFPEPNYLNFLLKIFRQIIKI